MPRPPSAPDLAGRRVLRLALGTALALWFSQAGAWPLSFITPIFTMLLLATPLPAPSLKGGIVFVVALCGSVYLGMGLLPFLEHQRWAGIVLFALALFHSFYFPASGGSAVLGTFATVGLTVVATVGSVTIGGLIEIAKGLTVGAVVGILFVWLAHAILPDPPPDPSRARARAKPPAPPRPVAIRHAYRALLIVLPVALLFLFSSASAAYTVVMIKVATMGQQASVGRSREIGRSLIASTVIGGAAAIVIWYTLRIWPSLLLYSILIALTALVCGRRIFRGAGMHPDASTWSYGFLTAIIIVAPSVLDGPGGPATASFYSRLALIAFAAVYGTVAVAVFDAFASPTPRRVPSPAPA